MPMTSGRKKSRSGPRVPRLRNPFAGRKRSGAGPHSDDKYGKKDRQRSKREIEDDTDETGPDEQAGG